VLISVVIPAFNAERYISETVGSVLAQSHSELEVIVVDDGSTDSTRALVERLGDPRVRVVAKPNGGLASARNAGLRACAGDAIAFLDADDLFDRAKLETQVRLLDASEAVAVASPMRLVSAEGRRSWAVIGKQVRRQDLQAARLMPAPISGMLFSAAAIAQAGEFDESLKQAEDLDFVARVAQLGPVLMTTEVLGAYRLHKQSMTATSHLEQQMWGDFVRTRMAARQAGTPVPELCAFLRDYRVSPAMVRQRKALAHYRSASLAIVNDNPGAAGVELTHALFRAPLLMTGVLSRKALREITRTACAKLRTPLLARSNRRLR
jgi:GT2 family glycosyltransferase